SVQQAVSGQFDVNPKQFIRVVDNLMTNAIYHTPIKGNIWLTALSENINLPWLFSFVSEQFHFDFEHNAYVIVQNEGKGIPKDHMTYLFDPLYQVDVARTKREAHGSGLGLTITKQI